MARSRHSLEMNLVEEKERRGRIRSRMRQTTILAKGGKLLKTFEATRAFLNDPPGGASLRAGKKGCWLEKGCWLTPPLYRGLGWPKPKFPYKKIVGTTQKLSKNRRLRRESSLFPLHYLSYSSPFLSMRYNVKIINIFCNNDKWQD